SAIKDTRVLMDDWRIACAWYSSIKKGKRFKYTEEQVVGLAKKIVKELKRRGITFHPEKMKPAARALFRKVSESLIDAESGIYLVAPHAKLIADGKKTAIVKTIPLKDYIGKDLYLLSGKECYGVIRLGKPKVIDLDGFKATRQKHMITDEERKRWWRGKTHFYLFPVKVRQVFDPPKQVKIPQGVQTVVRDVEFLSTVTSSSIAPILPKRFADVKVSPELLKQLTDQQLQDLHNRLHDLYKQRRFFKSVEPVVNLHMLVVGEMKRRGLQHSVVDDLDRVKLEKRLTLKEVVDAFPERIELVEEPYVWLVGGISNRGFVERDVDVLIQQEAPNPALEKYFEERLPKFLAERIHWVYAPDGPQMGTGIPLYYQTFVKEKIRVEEKKVEKEEQLAEIVLGKPFQPFKSAKGYRASEYQDIDEIYQYWAKGYFDEGIAIAVEEKFDGMRFIWQKKGDKIWAFSEDAKHDRAALFPHLVEEFRKIPGDWIFDSEVVEWYPNWEKPKPREDMMWMVAGKKGDDTWVKANVFDCLWDEGHSLEDLEWIERQKHLKKLIPRDTKHINRVDPIITHNREEFKRAIAKVSKIKGSEGAMCKAVNSKYEVGGRTIGWAKFKVVLEVDVIVLKKEKIEGTEKTYRYWCGVGPIPRSQAEKYARLVELNGKLYMQLGVSYNTNIDVPVGSIITVIPIRIRAEQTKDGKIFYTFMHPAVKHARPEKREPDDIGFIHALAMRWQKEFKEEQLETVVRLMPLCPYADDPDKCKLYSRFAKHPSDEKMALEGVQRLAFPIRCPYADKYRCYYAKSYFYKIDWSVEDEAYKSTGTEG
ncbi:MAG: ATP-dependent DNA ligase, partial [Methanosarcinales archaeon]